MTQVPRLRLRRQDIDVVDCPGLEDVGEIVTTVGTDDDWKTQWVRIERADPFVLLTHDLCERMWCNPDSFARLDVRINGNDAVFMATFTDDFGNRYVYVVGQYRNVNGIGCFEARWPD